ncbi:MAG TPA: type II secretion system protein [Candidatus Saccharibacteria bacterium]|nr:type II secretion system protein [Candidatus Saccharibacteria bacterium]
MVMFTADYANQSEMGWSIVEIMIVIAMIGILASLIFPTITSYQYYGRDAERASDVESIARAFEISYLRDAPSGGPTYPNTTRATTFSGYTSLFQGQDLSITKAPGTTSTTSIIAANNTTQPQSPTIDQYVYLPLTATGTLCNATTTCVRFLLYYRVENANGDSVRVIESVRQQ